MSVVVVNDASCLIDLRKGRLLGLLCSLPIRFVVPLPIRESELLDFTHDDWAVLDSGGMETYDLPPDRMAEAQRLRNSYHRLSANDCFCLVTAQFYEDSILLTGDKNLRRAAEANDCRVHGVLWVVHELAAANACSKAVLIETVESWNSDPEVFLPSELINKTLCRLRQF